MTELPPGDGFSIDRFGGKPAYAQIADWLREQIASGQIGPLDPVPSKRRLRARTGVSGQTYDRAIQILKSEGLLRTARGLGHFVVPPEER